METNIIYKYRAPGASWDELTTITYKTMDLTSDEVSNPTVPHGVGEIILLQPWYPFQDHAEEPQDYRVLERLPWMRDVAEHGISLIALVFVVTDPDA